MMMIFTPIFSRHIVIKKREEVKRKKMLSLLDGTSFRRVGGSAQRGPEWHGPCPVCGGRDRFHVWPEQAQGGSFWCRGCAKGGDLIEFYRWRDNLSYQQACDRAGINAKTYTPLTAPTTRRHQAPRPAFSPTEPDQVAPIWSEHAAKFADWCHLQLLANTDQQAWLAKRGIGAAMIAKYGLGWNPADAYRPRESWGLATLRREDGRPRKLWLPLGLVIPQWLDGQVARLRIRRPAPKPGEAKYYVVPGSGREPLISEAGRAAYVVLESELDAILLDGLGVMDQVGFVAMGSAAAKPTARCHRQLAVAVHLSISMDADPVQPNQTTGKPESAGAQATAWWLSTYATAERVPPIGGKDPGEMFERGLDVRAWVLAGLPPRFHLATKENGPDVPALAPAGPAAQETVPTPPGEPGETTEPAICTMADGTTVHVVATRPEWEDLVAAGHLVFSLGELERIQAACAGMTEPERIQAVSRVIDAKKIFPGAYVSRGEVVA
jgi:hypothetical protein